VGAFMVPHLSGLPLPLIVLGAGLTAMVAALVVGIPALRIQGLFLAVSTLAFGVVATGWLLQRPPFVVDPGGVFLTRPSLLGSERAVYYFALILLVGSVLIARNLRRSGPGRMLIAVRDNDAAARSAGVSATWTRLMSFAISGFLAGMAGVVFAYARQGFNATDFPPAASLTVLLMVAVGGLGSIAGAILGAVFMFGLPAIFGTGDLVTLFTSSIGVLIVLLYLPGGLASVLVMVRDAVADRVSRAERGLPPPERRLPHLTDMWRVATAPEPNGARPSVEHEEHKETSG
jgi:ABC-type branched-subunit amino acid transport system permease subunit